MGFGRFWCGNDKYYVLYSMNVMLFKQHVSSIYAVNGVDNTGELFASIKMHTTMYCLTDDICILICNVNELVIEGCSTASCTKTLYKHK